MGSLELQIDRAQRALKEGYPVIFPTDTVYGLGVSVLHAAGPDELYRLKKRSEEKPIAWLVSSPQALDKYGYDIAPYTQALARSFWPGALTLIVRVRPEYVSRFSSAEGTVGLRMPGHPVARSLIDAVGSPLATTSANTSGKPAPQLAKDLEPELLAQVTSVLNDDPDEGRKTAQASTVVDCTGALPRILREGPIGRQALDEVVALYLSCNK